MIEISKEFRFEAAHSLPHLPVEHKCHHLHGHSYRIRITCRGPINMETGFVIDYADISAVVEPIIKKYLDHKFLNDVIGPLVGASSAENLCLWFSVHLKGKLPMLHCVEVFETPTSCARYCPNEL